MLPDSAQSPEVVDFHKQGLDASYLLKVNADLIYFEGHFPSYPILPGVVQVDWACRLAAPLIGDFSTRKIKNLKFSAPICPGDQVSLRLQSVKPQQCQFTYYKDDQLLSKGIILYER